MEQVREVKLSQGKVAIVDAEDFARVSAFTWHYHHKGYAARSYRQGGKTKTERLHRFILGVTDSDVSIDHENRNKLDNRKSNLRLATAQQNRINQGPHPVKGQTSAYKGVSWNKAERKWTATIGFDKKQIHLGRFTNEIDAARAYDVAARRLHGEFAWLNFPNEVL